MKIGNVVLVNKTGKFGRVVGFKDKKLVVWLMDCDKVVSLSAEDVFVVREVS